MPTKLWPADNIFLAAIEEDIVALDVVADTYVGLLDVAQWMTLQPDGSVIVTDEEVALELKTGGFLQSRPPAPRIAPTLPRADFPLPSKTSVLEVCRAGLAIAAGTLAFRNRSLVQLIASASSPARPRRPESAILLGRRVAAYRAALPFAPFEGECLQRGFQLRRSLHRQGIAADWVFGVNTWPFVAHCWLQVGDLVLGDRIERVRLYTPIMVV